MRNFLRVLQLTLRRRVTFALTITCSLVVALFWGANLGLVKPIVDITFSGKSPHAWADSQVLEAARRVADLEVKVAAAQLQLPVAAAADRAKIRTMLQADQIALESERLGLRQAEAYHPWVVR